MSILQMSPDRFAAGVACLLLGVLIAACSSPTGPAVDREAEKRKSFTREELPGPQWQEAQIALPAYPLDENLIKVQLSGPSTFTFLVDEASISVGEDAVVRYTVVARSRTGAKNVIFEGLRCETGQVRAYAYGTSDQTWSLSSNEDWTQIKYQASNDYRNNLYQYYFCPEGIPPPNSRAAIVKLKRGEPYLDDRYRYRVR